MPLMSERASPWKRAPSRPPMVGTTLTALFSSLTVTFGGRTRVSCPFGPFTSIGPALFTTVTPFGTSTGRLPVRESRTSVIAFAGLEAVAVACAVMGSPHFAQELAADALLPGFFVGHHAAARAEDRDPHAGADARD